MGEKRIKIQITPELTRQIAVRRARNVSLEDLEKEFSLSRPVINRALSTDEARQAILDILRDDVALENAKTRREAAALGPLAIALLKKKLESGDLKAVEPALKASGIYVQNSQDKKGEHQAQTFTVILPGQSEPKEVPNEVC